MKTCSQCKKELVNTIYGSKCEDCFCNNKDYVHYNYLEEIIKRVEERKKKLIKNKD